jgi:excisionase family DNA binding protein
MGGAEGPESTQARSSGADTRPVDHGRGDTLSTTEAAQLLRVCRRTVIKWADDGDIPCWRTSGGHRRFSATELRATGFVPVEKPRVDPTVEAWAQTLEQVMTAAADNFSANADVRRARMIRQVRGRLVPRILRG